MILWLKGIDIIGPLSIFYDLEQQGNTRNTEHSHFKAADNGLMTYS